MKAVLALVVLWAVLLGASWWAASESRDDSLLVETRATHQAKAAQLPLDEFLRDRANRLAGKVLDTEGNVVAGATVSVYDAGALKLSAELIDAEQWLEIAPEVETTSDEGGEFEFRDLAYGGKTIVFSKSGFWGDVVTDVPFADGYGASGVDGTLRPATEPVTWRLLGADGEPATNLALRLLPTSFSGRPIDVQTNASGELSVDPVAGGVSQPPAMLIGEPGYLMLGSEEVDEYRLPDRGNMVLQADGMADGPVSVSVLPFGARRLGLYTRELTASGGSVTVPDVYFGRYEIWLRQEGKLGWSEVTHIGKPVPVEFGATRSVDVAVVDEEGGALVAGLAWQATPFGEGTTFTNSPVDLANHLHPLVAQTHTNENGTLTLTDLPPHGGHLLVEVPGRVPVVRALEAGSDSIEVLPPVALEVSVRTQRPFLPVEISVAGSPPQRGRTDAAGEAFAWAPHGNVVARAGFARKSRSYPKGYFVGHAAEALNFSPIDDRGRPRGCLYGFVTSPNGHPVEKAIVFAQGSGQPDRQETDEHGFYRFTALESGPYVVFALPPDEMGAYRQIKSALLSPTSSDEQGEAQIDFELHATLLRIGPVPTGGAPYAQILDESGAVVWTASREDDGMIWIRSVPPGTYEVVGYENDGDSGRALGTVELPAEGTEPHGTEPHSTEPHSAEHHGTHAVLLAWEGNA